MKRLFSIAFCILILCSLLLVGVAKAGSSAYSITEYPSVAACTVDGKWTTPDEWTDAPHTFMTGNATGKFGYDIQDFTNLGVEWIVEILTDNTNNTGDYWQISFDDTNSGGAAPDAGDYMIEIDGHTTLNVYHGTGSGWAKVTPDAGEITWANTIGTSMWNSTPHWILEVVDSSKTAGTVQIPTAPPTGMRIAAYDAATSTICAWAPSSTANNPNSWGLVADYSTTTIPEGVSLGAVVLLSSVAVMVGFYYLRKRPKTTNLTQIRL